MIRGVVPGVLLLAGAALASGAAAQDYLRLVGQHTKICGKIVDVAGVSKNCEAGLFLGSFADRPQFAVAVPRFMRASLPMKPEEYLFSEVCVTGLVTKTAKNVPIVRVEHAEQLEISRPPETRFGEGAARPCDEGAVAPVVVKDVKLQYTSGAMKAGARGIVTVEALVSDAGEVRDARLIRTLHPDLDREALQGIRKFKFKPGTVEGSPVPMVVQIELTFSLR